VTGIRLVNSPSVEVGSAGRGGDTLATSGDPSLVVLAAAGHKQGVEANGGSTPTAPTVAAVDNSFSLSSDKLTLVLMSYPGSLRFAVLIKILQKVVKWSFIEEVLLVWNGDGDKVPPILTEAITAINAGARSSSTHRHQAGGGGGDYVAPIRLLPQQHNRIDNRWRLASTIKTQAILNMDDDVNLYEDGARCMFNVWRSSPQSIISVDVRSHFKHSDRSKGGSGTNSKGGPFGPWGYIARDTFSDPNTDMSKKYSIGLPRVLLTSRQHLMDYEASWKDESSGLRDIVDRLLCDDIALNFVAANKTEARRKMGGGVEGMGAPGVIYAKAHFEPYPESHSNDSLYKKKGMKEKRQRCVNELAERFGMSLQPRSWHVLCSVDG
jgi:hypothetical protein